MSFTKESSRIFETMDEPPTLDEFQQMESIDTLSGMGYVFDLTHSLKYPLTRHIMFSSQWLIDGLAIESGLLVKMCMSTRR
jgi:hypothetical protein